MLVGFYNYTVILTYISLFVTTVGIFLAITGDIRNAIIALMISGFCDMFDGKIACRKKRSEDEKRFGIQIDSLCDLICFGVFPTIICYQMSTKSRTFILFASIYILAGLIRLAYFNVMEGSGQGNNIKGVKVFEGLPITSISLILPLLYIICGETTTLAYSLLLFFVSIAFLVPIKIKKPRVREMIIMSALGLTELITILIM